MARLPTLDDLGARPVPVSRRGVASVRNAGAVADAVGGLGAQVAQIGQTMLEKEDKLSYAAARAALLKADVAARNELQDDPDYETFGARYNERMKAAREQAASMIKSRSDRSLFEAEAGIDVERGLGEVNGFARGKRIAAQKGTLAQGLIDLNEAGAGALDDATREQTIKAMNDLIDGGIKSGILTPEEAVARRRSAVQSYVTQQYNARMNRGDIDGASAILETNRGRIDGDLESRMDATLIEKRDDRDTSAAADTFFASGGGGAVKAGEKPSAPVSNDTIFRSLITQESGGRAQYGPATAYGRAEGVSQMLPGTAQQMARKVGVAWHPELMGDNNSKEAVAYQKLLGRAYFDEGMAKYKGDVRKALMYYHGGPDEKIWGPKTREYADSILNRVGVTDQQSPGHYDLNDALDWADGYAETQGWTPEKRDALKKKIASRIALDEQLKARQDEDIENRLWERADALQEKLTDPSQLGPDFYRLPAEKRRQFRAVMERNLTPVEPKANGEAAQGLSLFKIEHPDDFAKLNLSEYTGLVTTGELASLREEQAKIRTGDPEARNVDAEISATIGRFASKDMKLTGDKRDTSSILQVQRIMRNRLLAATGGKRKPTDADYREAFDYATMEVFVVGGSKTPLYKLQGNERIQVPSAKALSPATYKRIRDSLVRSDPSHDPTDADILAVYAEHRGKPGFWQ